ncbi:uncharacterized protein LOC106461308 [Limulus polyphemus]|uniref:Uncharacterized protein LOC106461308 n=1 Tax=Limulus polyphemus TaxID=6850 RepID=A0ABM1SZQ2_LIMPO|nr:uncharacterized protein LOC106461308 [Limulus polyphemus]
MPQDEYNENKPNYPYENQFDISPPTAREITGSYHSSQPVANHLKKEDAYHPSSLHSEEIPSLKQSLSTPLEYTRANNVDHTENLNSQEQFLSKHNQNRNPPLTSVYPSHRTLSERDQNQQVKLKNNRSNDEHNRAADHDNRPSLAINKEIIEPIQTENGDYSYQDYEENSKDHPHLSASSGPQYILQPQPAALIASPAFAQDPVSPLKSSYTPHSNIPKKTKSVPDVVTVPISPVNNKTVLSTSDDHSNANNGQKSFQTPHPVSNVANKQTYVDWTAKMDTYKYDMETWPECAKTSSMYCLDDSEYPSEVIRYAIDKERHVLNRLLAEIKHQSTPPFLDGLTEKDEKYIYEHHHYAPPNGTDYLTSLTNNQYKEDGYKNRGYICPSEIDYARPLRALNAFGQWKLILNLDTPYKDKTFTQTVLLEKCMSPGAPCSFLDDSYSSRCLQKYNYQRLLAWTYENGFHIDSFRLPVSCSCHVSSTATR